MKCWLAFLAICFSQSVIAKQFPFHSLYLADRPTYADELSMVGEFGFLVARGNTNTSSASAKLETNQDFLAWGYQVIANTYYQQSQQLIDDQKRNETSAQKLFLSTQYEHKLNDPSDRVFIYSEYENNRFSGFHYQAALAAGWTSKLWNNEESQFKYSLGTGYAISERKRDSQISKGVILRAAMEYKRKFSNYASFRQLLSTETDNSFTKAKSETSISTRLTGDLAMKLSFIMDLDKNADQDNEELDTEAMVSLVYQFF